MIAALLALALAQAQPCAWQGSEDASYLVSGTTAVCVADCASDCWTFSDGLLRLVVMVPAEDSASTVPAVVAATDQACDALVFGLRGGNASIYLTDPPVSPSGRLSPGWLDFESEGGCFVETRWPLGWGTPTDGGGEEWADDVCGRISSLYDFIRSELNPNCERMGAVGTSGGAAGSLCLMAAGGEVAKRLSWVYFSSMAPLVILDAIIAQLDATQYRWTETYHTTNEGSANCGTTSASDSAIGSTAASNQVYALPWPKKEQREFLRPSHSGDALCQSFSEFATLRQLAVELLVVPMPTPTPTPTPTPIPTPSPTPTPAPLGACCNQMGTACHEMTEAECADRGGIWQGAGSLCSEECQ